jgi:ribosomal protein L29
MKKADVFKIKQEDLEDKRRELKKELFNLQSSSLAGEDSQKKKAKVKAVKKNIARILTRLNNE